MHCSNIRSIFPDMSHVSAYARAYFSLFERFKPENDPSLLSHHSALSRQTTLQTTDLYNTFRKKVVPGRAIAKVLENFVWVTSPYWPWLLLLPVILETVRANVSRPVRRPHCTPCMSVLRGHLKTFLFRRSFPRLLLQLLRCLHIGGGTGYAGHAEATRHV